MLFPNIVEYPFFTRSELSNGVQLADQMAYNVYRAFRNNNMNYSYFEAILPSFYRSKDGTILHGLKVWPDNSPLFEASRAMWEEGKQKPSRYEGAVVIDVRLGEPYQAHQEHPTRLTYTFIVYKSISAL